MSLTLGLWNSISRQLSEPSGLGGRVIARLMNRGNAAMNALALDHLGLQPGQRVLELGFGGGASLPKLLDAGAEVTGIDRAADMVAAARERYRDAIAAGDLTLADGDVLTLPFADASFDRVLTINTVYFWPDLEPALGEIARVLDQDGRLVIGIRDPSVMQRVDREIFTIRPPEEVRLASEVAGFTVARLDSPSEHKVHFVIASS